MITTLLTLSIIFSGVIWTIIYPVYLPNAWIESIRIFAEYLWTLNGIIPVYAIFDTLSVVITVLCMTMIFKIVIGVIALFTGAGKPEID